MAEVAPVHDTQSAVQPHALGRWVGNSRADIKVHYTIANLKEALKPTDPNVSSGKEGGSGTDCTTPLGSTKLTDLCGLARVRPTGWAGTGTLR